MNLEKHKTGVGAFILVALALLVAGIVALGGEKYVSSDAEYVCYFNSSVSGLSIGSPVMLRGVTLGSVTRISLQADSKGGVATPVHLRINTKSLAQSSGERVENPAEGQEIIHGLIKEGLRAQLQTASFLTGQVRIYLDFYPNSTATFHSSNPLLEIPTIDSPIESLQKSLGEVPINEILDALKNSLFNLNEFLASRQLEKTLTSVTQTFDTANSLLEGFRGAPESLDRVLANLEATTADLKTSTPEAMADFRKAVKDFGATCRQVDAFVATAGRLVAPDAALTAQLERILKDGAAAVRSLRNLADALERNPESILRGRKGAY